MINATDKEFVLKYVDDKYYDTERLIKYLTMHDTVGNEVFQYCDRRVPDKSKATYSQWLDDEDGYCPLPVDDFIRRVPFYFYTRDYDNMETETMGTLHYLFGGMDRRENMPEVLYEALEYMFYGLGLSLVDIFNYYHNQTGQMKSKLFFDWYDYLTICAENGSDDYFPERFITAYNEALESVGRSPVIYEVDEIMPCEYYFRNGTVFEVEGTFPCDSSGNPIMKWIGIDAKNVKSIRCSCQRSEGGKLKIELAPDSVIRLLNVYNYRDEEDDYWYQVYAGPLHMEFDYSVLKSRRLELGFTQQGVADAIGAAVRTYQKWESGETTPDGHYLLRLLNWLDIPDIQTAIDYSKCE